MSVHQDKSTILSLRGNVSDSDALHLFSALSPSYFAWRLRKGPLQKIAAAYVPFALYTVRYQMDRSISCRFFGLDQVDGTLDLFEFPKAIAPQELIPVESSNRIAPKLSNERAQSLLYEKVLRIVFQQGFFRLQKPKLQIDPEIIPFAIPYWLGFYGQDGSLGCRVLDAVRGRMEGQKATVFFERWLMGA